MKSALFNQLRYHFRHDHFLGMLVLLRLHVVGFWHKLFNPVITAVVELGGIMSGAQGVLQRTTL